MNEITPLFNGFRKIPRWSRDIVITEKIDGTNGLVWVGKPEDDTVLAGSKNKWIYPGKQDNHGFAAWVQANRGDLMSLGPGYHYGEWWGKGIARGYNLEDKRFALFNTTRWKGPGQEAKPDWEGKTYRQPLCCGNVPTLYEGPISESQILLELATLAQKGSRASPGFMKPEGVVIYHVAGNIYFKKTIEHDEAPKGIPEE